MAGAPVRVFLFLVVAASAAGPCRAAQWQRLPLGDAGRGAGLFRSQNCVACHGVGGRGASSAPDLAAPSTGDYTPARLAGLMWNHAPMMWAAIEQKGIARPRVTDQDIADLFAFFYAARYFDRSGDPRRGKDVFASRRCSQCHGTAAGAAGRGRALAEWRSMDDPVALAQQMWNHAGEMKPALRNAAADPPLLGAQDLADLLAYVRTVARAPAAEPRTSASAGEGGRALLESRGCVHCHQGPLALEGRQERRGTGDLAAALWNHPFRIAAALPPLTYDEMRRLVDYLAAGQFAEERGDPARGARVAAGKRCLECHTSPSGAAPGFAALRGKTNSYTLMAALWKHGPAMLESARERGIPWPQFSGSEMADLSAWLNAGASPAPR